MRKLLILDDDLVVARKLSEFICAREDFEITVTTSAREALVIIETQEVEAVLCDIRMPEIDGIQFTHIVRSLEPAPVVIGMTAFDEDHLIIEMLRAGAIAMILKTGPRDEFIEAIDAAFSGKGFISPYLAPRLGKYLLPMSAPNHHRPISEREQEILSLVIMGYSNPEIAEKLYISVGTVKKHLSELFLLFNVDSRLKLVVAALR